MLETAFQKVQPKVVLYKVFETFSLQKLSIQKILSQIN